MDCEEGKGSIGSDVLSVLYMSVEMIVAATLSMELVRAVTLQR